MEVFIQQTHHDIADFNSIFETLVEVSKSAPSGSLHVFPELYLTGYPLQDICLQKSFTEKYKKFLKKIDDWSKGLKGKDFCFLLGGLHYFYEEGKTVPYKIENVTFSLVAGEELVPVYTKMLLPNYDIFEEKKYYSKGTEAKFFTYNSKKVGLLICEDMWHSSIHNVNPVEDLRQLNEKLDLVVNLSASPYNLFKVEKRVNRAYDISKILKAPFVYVNRVGAEDEIIFDGNSLAVNGNELIKKLNSFESDSYSFELPKYSGDTYDSSQKVENTWEGMFLPNIDFSKNSLPKLKALDDFHCQEIIDALCFGLQDYAKKSYFNKFLIALSGGIDSALVLALIKISLKEGQSVEAIYMPSEFSRDVSYTASLEMCEKANIPFHVLPIKGVHKYCRDLFVDEIGEGLEGLADENIQSRLRGMLLYARSNQKNELVINTSNKSELAVGYSTIYGDSVGAISLLGDLYKSEVYRISEYINEKYDGLIPSEIITRPPSAELRDEQVDTDSLPPYERMDAILEGILSYKHSAKEMCEFGFSEEEVVRVIDLHRKTEYKRSQFCPILKLKSKSFGFGYRVPISKNSTYYNDLDN